MMLVTVVSQPNEMYFEDRVAKAVEQAIRQEKLDTKNKTFIVKITLEESKGGE